MGKKKNVSVPNQGANAMDPSQRASESLEQESNSPEVAHVTNGVAEMVLSDKERGELARMQKSREEVMAERKAKKAAKAAAAEKKTAVATEKPAKQPKAEPVNKQNGTLPVILPSASTSVDSSTSAAHKNDAESRPSNLEPKSALRNKQSSKGTRDREVQFDLTANMIKSPSEDNLTEKTSAKPVSSTGADQVPSVVALDALSTVHIHPAFLTLASMCERDQITEIDELCEHFITAFKEFITDWGAERVRTSVHDASSLGIDLDQAIRPQLAHLTNDGRWPLPYALGNIVRQMKKEITRLGSPQHGVSKMSGANASAAGKCESLEDLQEWLEDTRTLCFDLATRAISLHLRSKMTTESKKIVTYDWCRVVNRALLEACSESAEHPKPATLHVVVLDQQMNGRGVKHIKSFLELDRDDVKLDYGDLRSLGHVMDKCSMVLLGCSAVLSNGCVAATRGSLQVALAAKANNVPLLVCAQTFKFVDKVQNYGRVALLGKSDVELVPADLVTAIVTDIRILPPTSAPAVLKAKALDTE